MATQWKESFTLHHDRIDAQHKELFRLANFVESLDPRSITKLELSALFKEFFDYMQEHFKEEEAYMASIEYPLLQDHQKLHQEIIDSITNLLREKRSIQELQHAMKDASHKWLVEHILHNDLKIEKWRKGNIVTSDIQQNLL
jgi:hemerythrin